MLIKQPPIKSPTPLKKGIYKHCKGGFYKVHGIAKQFETEELMVVYGEISRGLETGEGPWAVMSLADFTGEIEYHGKPTKRFQFVSEH